MKKRMTALLCVLSLLAILSPFVLVSAYAIASPPVFSNTFVGELDEKFDLLTKTEEPKIIVVGGSSVAFGLDSAMIEKYTGHKVVNFGLYAALGTKLMLDLSEAGIREGDIVLLAPEMDAQTLSLYFSSENTLNALDDDFSMVRWVKGENILSLLGGMWKFAAQKIAYQKDGAPDPAGVYNAKNFNAYGDVDYDRPANTMARGYDRNTPIDLSEEILSEDFCDYLNAYIDRAEKKGATVLFSWCPMNELALAEGTTDESIEDFVLRMKDRIRAPFVGEIEDAIMDPGYFYDTNFHCNNAGVIYHTAKLTEALLLELEKPTPVTERIPDPPKVPEIEAAFDGYDENAADFTYEVQSDLTLAVTGLSEAGKSKTTLTLPLGANGKKVTSIAPGAFSGSAVQTIVVPAGSRLSDLQNSKDGLTGALDGAENLSRLDLYIPDPSAIKPCAFHGMRAGFAIHTPEGSSYPTDYFWSQEGVTGLSVSAYVDDLKMPE